jgi:hypothetical protein
MGCQLTTPHKLQGRGAVGKPQLQAARVCQSRENRWPRPASYMRWLGRRSGTDRKNADSPGYRFLAPAPGMAAP